MRVLFVSAEVSPLAKTGGLGDVAGSLPKALAKLGHDVTVFMPLYRQAAEWLRENDASYEVVAGPVKVAWADWETEAVYVRTTVPGTDIPLILVANAYFFNREHLYSPRLDGRDDYLLRYTFFCRAVINGCELLEISPDIVHANDWHTALLPVYLHSGLRGSPTFQRARSVYTIHNLHYQGVAGPDQFDLLGLHSYYWSPIGLEHFGTLNPMKAGIIFADQVTTVSPNYAREIQTPEHGAGLDGVLRTLSFKLTGILNGIDMDEWDPATDPLIDANFSDGKLHGKSVNKRMLSREAGFKSKPKTPMLAVVSRLVGQKGFHLLLPGLEKLLQSGAQVVILGSGEQWLEAAFEGIAARYPDRCRMWVRFDPALAHRIYAGSDLLLMPSIYEPCGLNQMYALRYGTLPIARMTGGLVDTVIPYDGTNKEVATGFGFWSTSPSDLYVTSWIGMLNYKDSRLWKTMQHNGMTTDFSWETSAQAYDTVYRNAFA